jgi:hypothetical protein
MLLAALAAAVGLSGCSHDSAQAKRPAPATEASSPAPPAKPEQPTSPPSATPPAPPPPPTPDIPHPTLKEIFPHIRLDAAKHLVEIDGSVPIDAHNEKTPRVYLEVCVCIPDTKEHETLVVTKAKPSNVHAALLLAGLKPGKPGEWDWSGPALKAIPPTGDAVEVTLSYQKDGKDLEAPITDWVIDAGTHKTMTQTRQGTLEQPDHFVFAGSTIFKRQGREGYTADIDGTLVGLTTFGGETVAWTAMYNPDSGVETPHWIADAKSVPEVGTAVVVRIRRQGG